MDLDGSGRASSKLYPFFLLRKDPGLWRVGEGVPVEGSELELVGKAGASIILLGLGGS